MLFVRLFGLCLFGFVGFLFLLVSGKGCTLWLWHSLDFSLVINPIIADSYASLFNCTTAVRASDNDGLFVKLSPVSWGLTICLWLGPSWFSYWFSFTLAYSKLAMSTRLCLLLWLIWFLCFRFDTLTELGAFMRTEFLCVSVLRVASGPRVKLASCKSALNPRRPPPPPPPPRYFTLLTVRRWSRC